MDLAVVREIEEVSARAWPPLDSRDVDGWVLRAAGGVTGRANSVWPRADNGTATLDDRLEAAHEFYAAHQLPLLLQLSPSSRPSGLAAELVEREYAVTRAPRNVQTAQLKSIVSVGDAARTQICESVDDGWYDVVARVNASFAAHRTVALAVLAGVGQTSAYAVVTIAGVPAAAGRGVCDGDWLGIFNMATLPAYRRRGAAAAVLAALAQWARGLGATRAYLQLVPANDAALRLYDKAGFAHCYGYAFWGKRDSP